MSKHPDLEIITPQFEREDGYPPPGCPPEDFDLLQHLAPTDLSELGLRRWGRPEDTQGTEVESGPMLWLLPGEWYSKIPNGTKLFTISFEEISFELGVTDNDIRFGCLPYGILREE